MAERMYNGMWVAKCIKCDKILQDDVRIPPDTDPKEYVERLERIIFINYGCPNRFEGMPNSKHYGWVDDDNFREIFPIGDDD